MRDLTRRGYEVTEGYPKLYTQQDCEDFSYPLMRGCYGNNPAAPYVLPVVRSWPEEYVDPAAVNAFGWTPPGYSVSYRLDPREAIVVFGELPPPARYLGVQSYLFSGPGYPHTDSLAYRAVQARFPEMVKFLFTWFPGQEGLRIQSFSSVSNSINNVVIEEQSGASFGEQRYFVITPDRRMDQAVRQALRRLGVPSPHVFTENIASGDADEGDGVDSVYPPLNLLGLDEQADDFVTAIRYAMPEDDDAARAWREQLPLTVLRVRERPRSNRPPVPYPPLTDEPRSAPRNEGADPALVDGLDDLTLAVCERWGQPCNRRDLVDLQGPPINLVGRDCREIGMNCLAPTHDSSYVSAPAGFLDSGEVYAMVGTLATETGNATYVGLSVNDLAMLQGVVNVPDTKLAGSAAAFAATVANHESFYVHYFTRDCDAVGALTDGECTELTPDMVAAGVKFATAVRAYIAPGTARGPDPASLLRPRILTFSRP